jgi:hypothetical protein
MVDGGWDRSEERQLCDSRWVRAWRCASDGVDAHLRVNKGRIVLDESDEPVCLCSFERLSSKSLAADWDPVSQPTVEFCWNVSGLSRMLGE